MTPALIHWRDGEPVAVPINLSRDGDTLTVPAAAWPAPPAAGDRVTLRLDGRTVRGLVSGDDAGTIQIEMTAVLL